MPIIFAILILSLLTSCDFCRSSARIAYWKGEVDKGLPVGSSKASAEQFFRDRGLELQCCISGPPEIKNAHSATERNIGRELWMEYNATIIVEFKDDKVARTRVLRLGVGL